MAPNKKQLKDSRRQQPESCGATVPQTTILQSGRKLRSGGDVDRPPLERFEEVLARDPSLCCYGIQETLAALEFYAVDELLIAEDGLPMHVGPAKWKQLAMDHKVARLHQISRNTSEGRRFCKGYRVAGILSRPLLSFGESSPAWNSSSPANVGHSTFSNAFGMAAEAFATYEPPSATDAMAATAAVSTAADAAAAAAAHSTARGAFFAWLEGALHSELAHDEASALALLDCVHMILAPRDDDVGMTSDASHEGLEDAVEVLSAEAPATASELVARWCAAHLAESELERAAVAGQHGAELELLVAGTSWPSSQPSGADTPLPALPTQVPALAAASCIALLSASQLLASQALSSATGRQAALVRAATLPSWL